MLDILIASIARAGGIEISPVRHTQVPTPAFRPVPLFGRLVAGYRRMRDRREAYRALARLDDHALRDIGLDRGMIGQAADELANRTPATTGRPERSAAIPFGREPPVAAEWPHA